MAVCVRLAAREMDAMPVAFVRTYPVFATLFSVLFMDEAFAGRLAGALAMNLGGAALVLGAGARLGPHALGGGLAAGVVLSSVGDQWLLHHGLGFTTTTQGSLGAATAVVTAAALEALVVGQWPPTRTALAAVLMVAAVGLAASAPGRRLPVATDGA